MCITVAKKYGTYYPGVGYQVAAHWQAGLGDSSTVGAIFGALFNGWASSKWGYKRVMIGSLFLMNMFVFIIFFAPNVKVLLVGELFCGTLTSETWCLPQIRLLTVSYRSDMGSVCDNWSWYVAFPLSRSLGGE